MPTIKQPRKMQEVQKKLAKVKSPRKPAPSSPTKRALAISDDDDNDETGVNDTEADEVAKELEGGGRGSSKRRKASSSQGDKSNEGKGGSSHAKDGGDADTDANGDFDEAARLAQIEAELKLLKKWNKMPDWEDSIEDVETMDRADDLVLRARLCL